MKELKQDIPDSILSAIERNKTSLGNNPAIPDIYDTPYLAKACSEMYSDYYEKLSMEYGENDHDFSEDKDNAVRLISKLLAKCIRIEQPYRSELERMCFNYILDIFSVPEDSVDIKIELSDEPDTNLDSVILDPEESNSQFEFDNVEAAISLRGEVYKRRFLNALCMGAAMDITDAAIKSLSDKLVKFDSELPEMYEKILLLNNYALMLDEHVEMTDDNKMQSGTHELAIGNPDEKVRISANGMIFPFLLCELIRGFIELFISHGLPHDKDMASAVLSRADFLKSEPWDMRLGPFLWEKVSSSFNDIELSDLPYLFKRIACLDVDKFNYLMKELLAGTRNGREAMSSLCSRAKTDSEYDKFVDKMDKMTDNKGIITDDFIHPDEF